MAPFHLHINITTMKKYYLFGMALLLLATACKKEGTGSSQNGMPIATVRVNGKWTEVSNTNGTTPAIVLIGGFGSDLQTWGKLYAALGRGHTVFTYNRAGIGASENIGGSRDAKTIAAEMQAVLDANNIRPPYILVAHSMGGIYARMYHHLHPGKVKGMVLIDATHENQLDSLLSMIPQPERDWVYAGMAAVNDSIVNTYPQGALKEEFRANFATNYAQIRPFPAITTIPMYVITSTQTTADNPPMVVDIQRALHQQWALAAGSNGRFVTTDKSGHYIQVEEPGLVVAGIQWVLSK